MSRRFRYLSVCSGIEAATVAWEPLGWKPAAFSEIEPFPRAVLAARFPGVPLHGDFTTIKGDEYGPIDLLVGGTPCQSFSVAGLRKGLDDDRGNLTLEFVRLADRIAPDWIVWENVPGVLSHKDNPFGCFLGALSGEDVALEPSGGRWTDAGCVLGPARAIAWRCLDAQYFGLAQRRKRVFVVASPRGRADPREVLFECEGLRRDSPPRREAGQEVAGCLAPGSGGGCGPDDNDARAAHLIADVTHSLRADGFDASEDGTGRGTPIVPVPAPMAFSCKDHGADASVIAPTLRAMGHDGSHANAGGQVAVAFGSSSPQAQAVAFAQNSRDELREMPYAGALSAQPGMKQTSYLRISSAVRRLTPRECERLQGLPPDWTLVSYRGKPAADGPRYRAVGNSMAVPCMAWIGRRIARFSGR